MGLRDRLRKLGESVEDIDTDRVRKRMSGHGIDADLAPLGELPLRVSVRAGGEVTRLRIVPRNGVPSLDVLLCDGTGELHAVFTGRRTLGGVEPGRLMTVEGLARVEHGSNVMLNPHYTLIAAH